MTNEGNSPREGWGQMDELVVLAEGMGQRHETEKA